MKKLTLILLLAMIAGCTPDPIPHCARCNRKYAVNRPGRDTSYLLCDKTDAEFAAYEQRENHLHPNSQTDCVSRDTTKHR
jgi:hypothetical protein